MWEGGSAGGEGGGGPAPQHHLLGLNSCFSSTSISYSSDINNEFCFYTTYTCVVKQFVYY